MDRIDYKLAKYMMIMVALVELALSQIHISAITKVFVLEIGFYLFLHIIFGLIVVFNLMSTKKLDKSNLFKLTVSIIVTAGAGGYYMYLMYGDYISNENVLLEHIQTSLIAMAIGIGIYIVGWLVILIRGLKEGM